MRGPYAKTAGRIEHILEVSLSLFAANGYRATTMKEIAERARISQTGLMHHFPTKADVLIALLARRDERVEALARSRTGSPLDRLVAIAEANERDPLSLRLHCVISAEAIAPDHPAHRYYQDRYGRVRDRLTAAFTGLRAEGLLRSEREPAVLARMLIALYDGLQLQWLLDPDSVDMEAAVREFLGAFVSDRQ